MVWNTEEGEALAVRAALRATILRRECCTDARAEAIRAQEETRPNREEA